MLRVFIVARTRRVITIVYVIANGESVIKLITNSFSLCMRT